MKIHASLVGNAAAIALVAAVATAGGATAGALVTGAQIEDGTVTGVDFRSETLTSRDVRADRLRATDVRDGSVGAEDIEPAAREELRGAPGNSRLEVVGSEIVIAALSHGSTSATCPAGKLPISVTGAFNLANDGVQTRIVGATGTVFGQNLNNFPMTLFAEVLCAVVEPDPEVES